MTGGLLVLGWHNIEPTWFFPGRPGSGTRRLARQLAVIRRVGNVLPLTAALDRLAEGRPLPDRAVSLSFDDGYADATVAAGLLDREGLTATFFLVPRYLDGDARPWWEDLARALMLTTRSTVVFDGLQLPLATRQARRAAARVLAGELRGYDHRRLETALADLLDRLGPSDQHPGTTSMLSWPDAVRLARGGHTIGSHSLAHRTLSRESPALVADELGASRAWLERALRTPVTTVAYPYGNPGDFDSTTESLARASGYRYGCSTVPGVNRIGFSAFAVRRQLLDASRGVAGLAAIRHSFGGVRALAGRAVGRRRAG